MIAKTTLIAIQVRPPGERVAIPLNKAAAAV
jgi:hypothetical protein